MSTFQCVSLTKNNNNKIMRRQILNFIKLNFLEKSDLRIFSFSGANYCILPIPKKSFIESLSHSGTFFFLSSRPGSSLVA